MTDHPEFIGLIEMLLGGAQRVEPHHIDLARVQDIIRAEFAKPETVNINRIDPDCPHGVEDVFDEADDD